VLGAACAAGGGSPADAAALAVHHLVAGACSAALRLLGLDPLDVARLHASLAELSRRVAEDSELDARRAVATRDTDLLPAFGAPLPDILAAAHAQTEVTLFAS
jgi:urease accessory protein